MDEEELFEQETEWLEGKMETPDEGEAEEKSAGGAAENPEEEAEGAAKKPDQTLEERAAYADLDRKRQLEAARSERQRVQEENRELLEALALANIPGSSAAEVTEYIRQETLRSEQERTLSEMQQLAEETGVPLEYLQYQAENEQLRRELEAREETVKYERAASVFMADKAILDTVDPKFFEMASEKQMTAFGAMRAAGVDAFTAHGAVKGIQAAKRPSGTEHMVPVGGNQTDGVVVPSSVLKDYAEMGYTKEEATKDYKRQIKKGK